MNKDLRSLLVSKLHPLEIRLLVGSPSPPYLLEGDELEFLGECGYLPLIKLLTRERPSWSLCVGATKQGHLHVLEWCRGILDDDLQIQNVLSNIALIRGHAHILQWLSANNLFSSTILEDHSEYSILRIIHVDSMRWIRNRTKNQYDEIFIVYAAAHGWRNILEMMRHTFGVSYESTMILYMAASACHLERLKMFHEVGWTLHWDSIRRIVSHANSRAQEVLDWITEREKQ